jgi:glucose-like phosphotransferase system IIB component
MVPIVLIILLAIVALVIRITRMNKKNWIVDRKSKGDIDPLQQQIFFDVYGGKENIVKVSQELSRLSVEVKNLEKVDVNKLKELGASGILVAGNTVKSSFGPQAASIYNLIK